MQTCVLPTSGFQTLETTVLLIIINMMLFSDLGNTWVRINDDDAELTWRDDKTNLIVGYTEWCNEVAVNTQLQAAVLISASPIGCWANQPSQVVTTFTCVIDNSTGTIYKYII